MAENNDNQGWKEWSNHVLKELERLNKNYEDIRAEVVKTNMEITKAAALKHAINDLKIWKENRDNIINPEDLKAMKKALLTVSSTTENMENMGKEVAALKQDKANDREEIDKLKTFKTKVITAGAISFFLLTTAITILGWFLS